MVIKNVNSPRQIIFAASSEAHYLLILLDLCFIWQRLKQPAVFEALSSDLFLKNVEKRCCLLSNS